MKCKVYYDYIIKQFKEEMNEENKKEKTRLEIFIGLCLVVALIVIMLKIITV